MVSTTTSHSSLLENGKNPLTVLRGICTYERALQSLSVWTAMQSGKDLLWVSGKGNMERGRDVQRKRWDEKWWWRAIDEKEHSRSSARRRSRRGQSRLYQQELLPLINCRIIQRLLESGGSGGGGGGVSGTIPADSWPLSPPPYLANEQ